MGRLDGKVALISGGARGQGAAESRLFAKEGAKVVLGDILDDEGKAVEAQIHESGGEAKYIHLDVTKEEDWRKAIEVTVSSYGKLNVLVNNAGIIGEGLIEDTSVEAWDKVMDVNAKGVFLGTKVAIPEMRKAGGGSIINIGSQLALVATPSSGPQYQASKGAVRLLSKSAAIQYAKEGIRVNSVHPGPIATPMSEEGRANEEFSRFMVSRIPLGRWGEPDEIAWGVLYLASDESSYVTGTDLVIDGGWTAQ